MSRHDLSPQRRSSHGKTRHDNHFGEELTARNETPVGKMVPLWTIEPDPNQPRSTMGDLAELVASIRKMGVLEPILVRPLPGLGPSGVLYRIISGERRYQASKEAGLSAMPVIEMDVSDQEALEIALIGNLQRKDLTPLEEAKGYRLLAENHGYTHEELAISVGKLRTAITESLSLLQMPARVLDTVQALGITSKSLLLETLKAGTEAAMIQFIGEAVRHGGDEDDKGAPKTARERAELIARRLGGEEFSAVDEARLETLTQRVRSLLPQVTSEEWQALEDISSRLSEAEAYTEQVRKKYGLAG